VAVRGAAAKNIVVEQMKTKSTKPTVTPDADKLARYIKELKSRAKLEKVMKRLEDIQKNANGNEARLPRKTRAKQSKPTNK
jgi:uncharacterized Zn finger protein (UPF0148 family)